MGHTPLPKPMVTKFFDDIAKERNFRLAPIRAEMFERKLKMYLYVLSFIDVDSMQACEFHSEGNINQLKNTAIPVDGLWPLLLTWFNFNPSMDK